MLLKRVCYPWLGSFAFLSLLAVVASAGSSTRQDHAWKRYYNPQWGYCVSYPSRWFRGDAFDGAGLFVGTGEKKFSKPLGEIDVAVVPNRPTGAAHAVQVALTEDLQTHLEGLRKFERAERMEVLEQRPMDLVGSSALFTRDRYYDPLERATWIEEVVFAHRNDVLYRLELECRADQLNRFEPVFTHLMSTFQFDCSNRR